MKTDNKKNASSKPPVKARNPYWNPEIGDHFFNGLGARAAVTKITAKKVTLTYERGGDEVTITRMGLRKWQAEENRFGFTTTRRTLNVILRHSEGNWASNLGFEVDETPDGPYYCPIVEASHSTEQLVRDLRQLADALSELHQPKTLAEAAEAMGIEDHES